MVINHLRVNHALGLVDDQCKQVWKVVYQHEHVTCILGDEACQLACSYLRGGKETIIPDGCMSII